MEIDKILRADLVRYNSEIVFSRKLQLSIIVPFCIFTFGTNWLIPIAYKKCRDIILRGYNEI